MPRGARPRADRTRRSPAAHQHLRRRREHQVLGRTGDAGARWRGDHAAARNQRRRGPAVVPGRLPPRLVAAIDDGQILRVRAGTRAHRSIGIWAVVVDGRVFVRSWGIRPDGWYRTFLEDPRGVITAPGRKRAIPVRAIGAQSERIKDEV